MAISDKSRKTLWARSGNRCAFCKVELVSALNENSKSLNLGDECHIISPKSNGPRHILLSNYDDYSNLILLCKNHHRQIDELFETFTKETLQFIKSTHEKWIVSIIDNAKNDIKSQLPKKLPRIKNGKEIVDIIKGAQAFILDHDEIKTEADMEFVAYFLQNIQDWGDVIGMAEFEIGRQVELGFQLNTEIKELEKNGFLLFGERRRSRMIGNNKKDLGFWDISIILIFYKENPAIVNNEYVVANITY